MSGLRLPATLAAWGRESFATTLANELGPLAQRHLPLQQMLQHGSHMAEEPVTVRLVSVQAQPRQLQLRIGVFFTSLIAGCSCADDPTPSDTLAEYGELDLSLDRESAAADIPPLA